MRKTLLLTGATLQGRRQHCLLTGFPGLETCERMLKSYTGPCKGDPSPELRDYTSLLPSKLNPRWVSDSNYYQNECNQIRSQQSFSPKSQTVDILGFAGHTVSVAATPLCLLARKPPHKQHTVERAWLCPHRTSFTKMRGGWIWPVGHTLLTPSLDP